MAKDLFGGFNVLKRSRHSTRLQCCSGLPNGSTVFSGAVRKRQRVGRERPAFLAGLGYNDRVAQPEPRNWANISLQPSIDSHKPQVTKRLGIARAVTTCERPNVSY